MESANSAGEIPRGLDVWMIHRDLARAPGFALPAGYRMRFYREGDIATWLRIQHAADPDYGATAEMFAKELPGDGAHLSQRVMFLADPSGRDIGTITAWNDSEIDGRDIGRIHWVAIVREAQGHGLAKPMLSAAIAVLREFGYTEAWLWTGTAPIESWPRMAAATGSPPIAPINLYRLFGFEPFLRDEADRVTWRALAPHSKLPLVI